jgi:hypothetical protein
MCFNNYGGAKVDVRTLVVDSWGMPDRRAGGIATVTTTSGKLTGNLVRQMMLLAGSLSARTCYDRRAVNLRWFRADLAERGWAISSSTLARVRLALFFVTFLLAATLNVPPEWFPLWFPVGSIIFHISLLSAAVTASDSQSPRATRLT